MRRGKAATSGHQAIGGGGRLEPTGCIVQKIELQAGEVANNTALYDATNNRSEYRTILSDSGGGALVSVIEEAFYLAQIIGDSISLQLGHQFVVADLIENF